MVIQNRPLLRAVLTSARKKVLWIFQNDSGHQNPPVALQLLIPVLGNAQWTKCEKPARTQKLSLGRRWPQGFTWLDFKHCIIKIVSYMKLHLCTFRNNYMFHDSLNWITWTNLVFQVRLSLPTFWISQNSYVPVISRCEWLISAEE
jgi:hypothetical protein